jgi:hypothetical protein
MLPRGQSRRSAQVSIRSPNVILYGLLRHLAVRMSNAWVEQQRLISIHALWIKAQAYA